MGKARTCLSGYKILWALVLAGCCPVPQVPDIGFEVASAQSTIIFCTDEVTREKIRTIMIEALDEALKQHIIRTFDVWMRDERGQPERARTGVSHGINAYNQATKSVMTWAPPDCPG
jgi:hypothetical protein